MSRSRAIQYILGLVLPVDQGSPLEILKDSNWTYKSLKVQQYCKLRTKLKNIPKISVNNEIKTGLLGP
jgi:hypothetical protein